MNTLDDIEKEVHYYEECTMLDVDKDDNIFSATIVRTRGLVDNYSNPIASIIAKLYERLLVEVHNNFDIDILNDMRQTLSQVDKTTETIGYFEAMLMKDKLKQLSPSEEIISKFETLLFDIQNASMDVMSIYADVANITKFNIDTLIKFCSDMAEVELKYLYSKITLAERYTLQDEIILMASDTINNELSSIGIYYYDVNYQEAVDYLKDIY